MKCECCPRKCGAERDITPGICGMGTVIKAAKASVHMWEEPCVSGERGSGTVFFSGCSLKCVFCQNREISTGGFGKYISPERLREIFEELTAQGVHNINLVNPTHFAYEIAAALEPGLPVPVVWNTGGYERVRTLKMLEGRVQIYLPDMKYAIAEPAGKYSGAADYPEIAKKAIIEMFRQTGPYKLDDEGILKSGVMIRHLILPGNKENTRRVIDWVSETFEPGDVLFSLMSQYTPMPGLEAYPELCREITREEYDDAMNCLELSDIEDGFYQEPSSAGEAYIPDFDLSGI